MLLSVVKQGERKERKERREDHSKRGASVRKTLCQRVGAQTTAEEFARQLAGSLLRTGTISVSRGDCASRVDREKLR